MKDGETNLWKRYHEHDPEALEDLVKHYIGLVRFWTKKMTGIAPWVEREDLMQEGLIALTKAIPEFEPDRGNDFSTYAGPWIRGALLAYLQSGRNLPRLQYENFRRIDQAQEALIRRKGDKPTLAEIAQEAGLTEQQVHRAIDAMAVATPEGFIDCDTGSSVRSYRDEGPENTILIRELLLNLNERERWVLAEFYDLGYTDREIADRRNLTPDHVKKIRHRALEKLGKLLDKKLGGQRHED